MTEVTAAVITAAAILIVGAFPDWEYVKQGGLVPFWWIFDNISLIPNGN